MALKDRREREKQRRRTQILEAAKTLVLREGVFAVSVQRIAEVAELSVGTIYLYFKGKEEIFAVLQEDILNMLYGEIYTAAGREGSCTEKLFSIADAYREFSRRQKQYFDVINYFLSPSDIIFPPVLKSEIDRHGNRILSLVAGVIEAGIKSGEFRKVDANKCSIILWGTLHGLIQFRKLGDTILKYENFTELYDYGVHCFINGFSVDQAPVGPHSG